MKDRIDQELAAARARNTQRISITYYGGKGKPGVNLGDKRNKYISRKEKGLTIVTCLQKLPYQSCSEIGRNTGMSLVQVRDGLDFMYEEGVLSFTEYGLGCLVRYYKYRGVRDPLRIPWSECERGREKLGLPKPR